MTKPQHLDKIYAYYAHVHSGRVDVTKFVYYTYATYEDVAGRKHFHGEAPPFETEWGLFTWTGDEWHLQGRTTTEHIHDCFKDESMRWYRDWLSAYRELMLGLAKKIGHHTGELARYEKLTEIARTAKDPTP